MKKFNTTGLCNPKKHYMVNIDERLRQMRNMIDEGDYFVISRARQYGKTTTLSALEKYLSGEGYDVISLDFQDIGDGFFENEEKFTRGFCRMLCDMAEFANVPVPETFLAQFHALADGERSDFGIYDLFRIFYRWCQGNEKPMVLMIDEVDSASEHQTFLDFLAQLRSGYLKREKYETFKTFQSVILAGVTDIRHLKGSIREETQRKVNSPWNIAADFMIDMSLPVDGIRGMLDEYEKDHHTGMDTEKMAQLLHDYTEGYPFLVSRLCQLMDEEVSGYFGEEKKAWTSQGFLEAVRLLINEKNALFDSLIGKLINFPNLQRALEHILMRGERPGFNIDQMEVEQMFLYGFIRNEEGVLKISNRIFEMRLYNFFLSEEEMRNSDIYLESKTAKNIFIKNGQLNMPLILEKFIVTYTEIFGPLEEKFKEKDGREQFLLYLKPIINGTGNYYIEAQTRDYKRTDVIVDYLGKQYVIELKIWHGERYHEDGEKQLREYLEYFHLNTGYMLSFNFNKKKTTGVKKLEIDGKVLFEGTL